MGKRVRVHERVSGLILHVVPPPESFAAPSTAAAAADGSRAMPFASVAAAARDFLRGVRSAARWRRHGAAARGEPPPVRAEQVARLRPPWESYHLHGRGRGACRRLRRAGAAGRSIHGVDSRPCRCADWWPTWGGSGSPPRSWAPCGPPRWAVSVTASMIRLSCTSATRQ